MAKKQKAPGLKDATVEAAYKQCKRASEGNPMCEGLLAQAKQGMISTDDYLDRVDDIIKRGSRKRKRKSAPKPIFEDDKEA